MAATTTTPNGTTPNVTIVVAQCVQRSFLSPLPGPDPRLKPCHLHAGYVNAIRLLGGGPQNLPSVLEDFLWHAHGGEDGTVPGSEHVHVVYVDDEHYDDGSELTEQHFAQFGRHCVPGEDGYLGTGRTAECERFCFPTEIRSCDVRGAARCLLRTLGALAI